jgi:long-chain acyl-CoA synthetase
MPENSIAATLLASLRPRGDHPILFPRKPDSVPWTASGLVRAVEECAAGFLALGLQRGDRVGLVADNRDLWLVADLALLAIGAVDVPRAGDASVDDILFVLEHAEVRFVIVEDLRQRDRLAAGLERLGLGDRCILLEGDAGAPAAPEHMSSSASLDEAAPTDLAALRTLGRSLDADHLAEAMNAVEARDLATIVYTSGTTGNPKGVMLSHANILHNVGTLPDLVRFSESDRYLSFLPSWHAFERTVEYCLLSRGSAIHYSSKSALRKDLTRVRPTVVAGVPRLWESIAAGMTRKVETLGGPLGSFVRGALRLSRRHCDARRDLKGERLDQDRRCRAPRGWEAFGLRLLVWATAPAHFAADRLVYAKLRAGTGNAIRFLVSGGGALPEFVDEIINRAGIRLLVGYGLTETAPVISVRLHEANVIGTSGRLLPATRWEVRHEDGERVLEAGEKGVLWLRGPQVMAGYYRNEEATRAVLRDDGWFCSGDLAFLSDRGDVVICGRSKDTIVLRGGENVEPEKVEARILESPFVQEVVLVGHGEKHLAALVVPEVGTLAERISDLDPENLAAAAAHPQVRDIIAGELEKLVSPEAGFRIFERVPRLTLLDETFSEESGTLTATMKKRRGPIEALYAADIAAMFSDVAPRVRTRGEP